MARGAGGNAAERYAGRKKDPVMAEKVLKLALRQCGLDREIARYRFVLHWKDIVGEEIAKRTKPECLKNNMLVVRVANSVWAQELSFHKELILKRLKKHLDSDQTVDDVLFYVAG